MEAKWQKQHKEVMELEEKKNKLLSEIEVLIKQRNDLVATLIDIRKEVSVHGGDYEEITAERVKVVDELDKKFIVLKEEINKKSEKQANLFKTINVLQNLVKELEEKEQNKKENKEQLSDEIIKLNSVLSELKTVKQNEIEEKRLIVQGLKDNLSEIKKELHNTKRELDNRKAEILREERLLSIRRSDLQIYEARMRKKYLNETFVLKE